MLPPSFEVQPGLAALANRRTPGRCGLIPAWAIFQSLTAEAYDDIRRASNGLCRSPVAALSRASGRTARQLPRLTIQLGRSELQLP